MSERSNTGETPDTDPRGDADEAIERRRKIRPPVTLDEPRSMMYGELVEEMGEDTIDAMVGDGIQQAVHNVVTALYDNREQVGEIRQQADADGG